MNIEKELNKTLTKIAKQIHKRLNLPKDIKRYINAEPFPYKLYIKWYYAGDYIYTMELKPEYCTFFQEIGWLASELHGQIVKFASDKALKELTKPVEERN